MEKKKWWWSKTIWVAVTAVAVAVTQATGVEIPEYVYTVLAALGLYGLRVAKKTLTT